MDFTLSAISNSSLFEIRKGDRWAIMWGTSHYYISESGEWLDFPDGIFEHKSRKEFVIDLLKETDLEFLMWSQSNEL